MEERSMQWRNHFVTVPKAYSLGMVSPSKSQQQQQQQHQHHQHHHLQEGHEQQPSRENIKWDKSSNLRIQRGPKPLEKKSFYLDIKNHTTATKIETRIKDLGGSIEVFLVRGVSLVASDRVDKTGCVNSEKRKWGFTSGGSGGFPSLRSIEVPTPNQTPPIPFFSSECPLSNSTNLRGSTAQRSKSRVDAMLERALIQPQQYSVDPLDNAQSWGIPIWAVDKLQAWLDKISASIKDTEHFQCKKHSDQNISTKDTKIRQLKGPFLKFESYHRNTRPVFFELPTWPKLNLDGEPGFCPFGTKKREAFEYSKQTKRRDVKENRREVLDLASRGQHKDMTRRQRTATTRARRTEHLTSGYCEICRTEYRDLSKHVQSDQHLTFVRNDDNFLSLDRLINAGANVEAFLKLNRTQAIERNCSLFPEDEHGLDGIVAGTKGVRDTKSLESYSVTREIKMVQCNGSRRNFESKLTGQPHNLRTRMKHESGHLLRSKGSPWHELEKSDKFYDKFEGFTVKKRAKGTIWIEEEEHPDANTFLHADSGNGFANLKQEAYSIANLTRKSETASEKVVDTSTCAKKRDEGAVSPLKTIIRAREQPAACHDNAADNKEQEQVIENGKANTRINGILPAEANRANEPSNQCVYEYTRARNCKSLTPEESASQPRLAAPTEKLPRLQTQETHPQQDGPFHCSILSNGCPEAKHRSNGEIQGQERARDKDQKVFAEKDRFSDKDVETKDKCGRGPPRLTAEEDLAEKNKEKQDAQKSNGKPMKWSRRGGRNGTRARHRLSVEERLIEDNRAYYKVEVLGSKLRSSVLPSGTSTVSCSLSKDVSDESKKEAPSSEKPVVVRFKRVRKSELSLLSDEAESFMFGEQKRDNSSEISEEEQSSILPRDTEQSERGEGSASSVFPSSSASDGNAIAVGDTYGSPVPGSCSSLDKSEGAMNEDDSQDSLGGLGRARKRRRTQAEALIKDNTDYYKFETPGSRLRYQGTLAEVKSREHGIIPSPGAELGNAGEAMKKMSRLGRPTKQALVDLPEKVYPSKPSAEVEKLQFSFEAVPRSEPWYQTYQRQDQGAEYWHYFSESDIRKPFLLPYEIENFHEILSRCQSRVEVKRKGRGRTHGGVGRSPRKSPRCHASTLAIMSTIIRKKEQQQQQQQYHQPVTTLCTIDENESIGSQWPNSAGFNEIRAKSEATGELREMARTIDEMLDAKDSSDLLDSVGAVIEAEAAYTDTSLYDAGIPRGPPSNLVELLDNCHDIVNCIENSSCASSECGEGNLESPLKRRKKRKNRTGWPGIKLKRKLQHNKSPSEVESEREARLKNSEQCDTERSAETLRIPAAMKLSASDFSLSFPQRAFSSNTRDFPFTQMQPDTCWKADSEQQLGRDKESAPGKGSVAYKHGKGSTEVQNKNENKSDVGPSLPPTVVASSVPAPSPDPVPALRGDVNEEEETRHQSEDRTETTVGCCDEEPSSSIAVRSLSSVTAECREGGGGGPLTERDAAPSKDYNVPRSGTDAKAAVEVPEYELGNDENHENHENQQRRPATKVPIRKRHRDNTSSSGVHDIHHELEKCEASDCDQGVHAGTTTVPECEIERHTGAVYKRNSRVSSRKRRIHSPKRRARRDSIRCAPDAVFENETCKNDSYLSMSYGKQQQQQQQLTTTRSSKQQSEGVTSTVQETEIDTPLSERISSRLVSSSELEQRRSSIDFQPVVRMMKIDEQVDVDHGILSVTVASNRRLRSSSSPRSSNPPPKKRLKTSVNRGQFGRLLKGS